MQHICFVRQLSSPPDVAMEESAFDIPLHHASARPEEMGRPSRAATLALVMSYLQNQSYPLVIEQRSQALQRRGLPVLKFSSGEADANGVLEEILRYQGWAASWWRPPRCHPRRLRG